MCPCFEWRFCGVLGMEVCGVVNPMFTGQKDYRLPLWEWSCEPSVDGWEGLWVGGVPWRM